MKKLLITSIAALSLCSFVACGDKDDDDDIVDDAGIVTPDAGPHDSDAHIVPPEDGSVPPEDGSVPPAPTACTPACTGTDLCIDGECKPNDELGTTCDETYEEKCVGNNALYCNGYGKVTAIRCDNTGATCGFAGAHGVDCMKPCDAIGDDFTEAFCEEYEGTNYAITYSYLCAALDEGGFGAYIDDSEENECNAECEENEATGEAECAKIDPDEGTTCGADYAEHCTDNAIVYCSDGKVVATSCTAYDLTCHSLKDAEGHDLNYVDCFDDEDQDNICDVVGNKIPYCYEDNYLGFFYMGTYPVSKVCYATEDPAVSLYYMDLDIDWETLEECDDEAAPCTEVVDGGDTAMCAAIDDALLGTSCPTKSEYICGESGAALVCKPNTDQELVWQVHSNCAGNGLICLEEKGGGNADCYDPVKDNCTANDPDRQECYTNSDWDDVTQTYYCTEMADGSFYYVAQWDEENYLYCAGYCNDDFSDCDEDGYEDMSDYQ